MLCLHPKRKYCNVTPPLKVAKANFSTRNNLSKREQIIVSFFLRFSCAPVVYMKDSEKKVVR